MTVHQGNGGIRLDDVYALSDGSVLMSGIQALVRLTLEQMGLDRRRGFNTATFVSGYPGSPLGGVDMEFHKATAFTEPLGIRFQDGLNEELAATAVAGTQLLDQLPGARHQGVVGFWFGKNPGLDRAADAIRHGNYAGTMPLGGAVALIGDDPSSKSSTLPSSSAEMCESLMVPALNPSTVAELVSYGLHAVAMSRAAGTWSALRVVTDLADAAAVVDLVDPASFIPVPDPDRFIFRPTLLGARAVEAEQHLFETRIPLAQAYGKANHLNAVTFEPSRPRLGIIASGVTYAMVLRAFEILGIDEAALEQMGVRLIKIGLIWPLDHAEFRGFTDGLEQVFVIEDKRPFLELHIRDALYGAKHLPVILGKEDADGSPLVARWGSMDIDGVVSVLARVLKRLEVPDRVATEIARVERPRTKLTLTELPVRQPYFCSGCPHNRSTRAADDQLVGVGIGCHVMIAFQEEDRGHKVGITQMGGEGTQWIGLAPFTDDAHYLQNIGDGTFFHSGSLAIRASVVAGVNITYKLLYNRAVAMTGGQRPTGVLEVPQLTRWLALEGVRKIIVTTPEPEGYHGVTLDPIAEVRHRDDLDQVQAELKGTPGVTVLIHDDRCAAEERRLRKRGKVATPAHRVYINERVCEGCGDCEAKSTCLSVEPITTEFGSKTAIHQSSCNFDFSCVNGDCPSFVLVEPGEATTKAPPSLPITLAEPTWIVPADDVSYRMPGIGGTGVVTVSRILQMAARVEGKYASGLDQTGLAQKGGPVISDVRITTAVQATAPKASEHEVDVVIGFDVLGVVHPSVADKVTADRTVAIVNLAEVPTHDLLNRRGPDFPTPERLQAILGPVTRASANVYLDAQWIAQHLTGDHMATNLVLLGAAFQAGCIPLSSSSIEEAIVLNGAAVEQSKLAFTWGRAAVVDLGAVRAALDPVLAVTATRAPAPAAVLAAVKAASVPTTLTALLEHRASDLVDYQDAAYALAYVRAVGTVAEQLAPLGPDAHPVLEAYIRFAYKLRAYKDEYEVARLHLDPVEQAKLEATFGHGATAKVQLHPPVLRAMGMGRKLSLGALATPSFVTLRAMRRLRGTVADPFGKTAMRKLERALIGEYDTLVHEAIALATTSDLDIVAEVAQLPEMIRGYESIKEANVARFRAKAADLLGALRAERATSKA